MHRGQGGTIMKEQLQNYLLELEAEHKKIRNKYRTKCKDSNCFMYSRTDVTAIDGRRLRNIKEQKLHINRLLKLMGDK